MSRFKKDQTVYSGRGDKLQTLVIARVHKNPMLPIHQYAFKPPNDGYLVGEQSIRGTIDGKDLTLGECMIENNEIATRVNTIMSAKRNTVRFDEHGVEDIFNDCNLFFRPDIEFCEWLKEYAGERLIIDVGSGQGHLVRMLKMVGVKRVIGIEPNIDKEMWIKWRLSHDSYNGIFDVNEILQGTVESHKKLIYGLKEKVLLVFARPCHSDFVETGIYNMHDDAEALYITVPENLERYNDLGSYKKDAVLLDHKGSSEDSEVVYSIKKNG